MLQVLTSDTTATAVGLLYWLRARWRIENMFKYATARGGIDALADYGMDVGPDTRKVTNPARTSARKTLAAAQDELATAERALPQLLNGQGTPRQKNAALPGAHHRINYARRPPPTDLPARQDVNLNSWLVSTCGGLSLAWRTSGNRRQDMSGQKRGG